MVTEKSIPIKPGYKDGTKITRERGRKKGKDPGDITFVIQAKPHDKYTRDMMISFTCDVTLEEALSGVNRIIRTLDGRQLHMNLPSVTGEILFIRGEGSQ